MKLFNRNTVLIDISVLPNVLSMPTAKIKLKLNINCIMYRCINQRISIIYTMYSESRDP